MEKNNLLQELNKSHSRNQIDRLFHISLRKKYVFCRVPKVANSSLKAFLFEAEYRDCGQEQLIPRLKKTTVHKPFYGPLVTPMQLTPGHLERVIGSDKFFKFAFVRNPLDRLISCYLDRVSHKESVAHKAVCASLNLEIGSKIPLADFVELVASQTPKEMDPHWRSQYHECGYGVLNYDKIYKLENMAEGISEVLTRFYPKVASQIDTGANFSPKATGATSRKDSLLTPDMEKKLRKTYEADFETFGY